MNEEEERNIDLEYKIWKLYTPLLYEFVIVYSLNSPAYSITNLYQNENSENYLGFLKDSLFLINTSIPKDDDIINIDYQDESEFGGFGISQNTKVETKHLLSVSENANILSLNSNKEGTKVLLSTSQGPYFFNGNFEQPIFSSIEIEHQPIVARHHFSMNEYNDKKFYIWNTMSQIVECIDLNTLKSESKINAKSKIMDFDWNSKNENIFGIVDEDKKIQILDQRTDSNTINSSNIAHDDSINCIKFHPELSNLFATASNDKSIKIWDLRNFQKEPLFKLQSHNGSVRCVKWNPLFGDIIGSCGLDRKIMIWDLANSGKKLKPESQDGPPELLFIHGGHTTTISDFTWNYKNPWVVASTSFDNILEIWEMNHNIYLDFDEFFEK
ncbi:wd40 repeat family [Anaeramoeba ignava]|uniref:Wd40 repeat family n=1 Tax=Anaeramoeba ignava TaxID=1746090 RepID=A0A9Q0LUG0_ANAIG|nr:wd40 repeat family [Anaeramoeba ignava]